jgi:hypothetical protein
MPIVSDVVECCRSEARLIGADPLVVLCDLLELAILSGDQGQSAYTRACGRYHRHTAYRLRSMGWRLLWQTVEAQRDLCGDIFRELWRRYEPMPQALAELIASIDPIGVPEPFFADVDCRSGRILMAASKRQPERILHGLALTHLELRATALNLRALNVRGLVAFGTVEIDMICEAYTIGRTHERLGICRRVRPNAFAGVEARFRYTIPDAMKRRRTRPQKIS